MNTTKCGACRDTGTVCENHPGLPWTPTLEDDWPSCACGAGMPCPICTVTPPQDGTHSIAEAFEPGTRRRLEEEIRRAEWCVTQTKARIAIGEQIVRKTTAPDVRKMLATEHVVLAQAEARLAALRARLAA